MRVAAMHGCGESGLGAWDQVNCYCERAGDPGFWAEPLNALSNAAFLVAAVFSYWHLRAQGPAARRDALPLLLIVLMAVVGTGSFLFHSFATVWARMADVAPIGAFIALYVYGAYRRLIGLSAAISVLVAVTVVAATFAMPPGFNGSLGYAPALLALIATAVLLHMRGHRAAGCMTMAGSAFAVSLLFRTIDRAVPVCGSFPAGTHWAWHLLNAAVLYMLVRAMPGEARGKT